MSTENNLTTAEPTAAEFLSLDMDATRDYMRTYWKLAEPAIARNGTSTADGAGEAWSVRWEHVTGRAWITEEAWSVDTYHRDGWTPCDVDGIPAPEGHEDDDTYGYVISGRNDSVMGSRDDVAEDLGDVQPRFFAEDCTELAIVGADGEVTDSDYLYGDGSVFALSSDAAADDDARNMVARYADPEAFAMSFNWDGRELA